MIVIFSLLAAFLGFVLVMIVKSHLEARRVCPKHGPFRFPPGCAGCQRYLYEELAKGRDGFEIIFEDFEHEKK